MLVRLAGILLGLCLFFTAGPGFAEFSEFGTTGLQVVPLVTGEIVVLAVVEGSPAARAGVKPGDLIIEVDGFGLEGSDFRSVTRRRLWGEPGSSIELIYLRPGEKGRRRVELVREHLSAPSDPPPGVRLMLPGEMTDGTRKK